MLHRLSFVTFVALTLAASSPVAAAPTVVAQSGDPTISHNAAAGTLALSAGGTTLTLNLDASHDFAVDKLVTASNGAWAVGVLPDTFLTIDKRTLLFGSRAAGFKFVSATAKTFDQRLQLDAAFNLGADNLRVTRHYAVAHGSPTFEMWTSFGGSPSGPPVSDINAFQLNVANGVIHWVTGLNGDSADVVNDAAFSRQSKPCRLAEIGWTLGCCGIPMPPGWTTARPHRSMCGTTSKASASCFRPRTCCRSSPTMRPSRCTIRRIWRSISAAG
jgi:hypothetical protein